MKIKIEPIWAILFLVAMSGIYYYVFEIRPFGKAQTIESLKERFPISSAKENQSSSNISNRAVIEAAINRAVSEGLIKKLDAQAGKAWIAELTWASIDSEVKENITKVLAAYCAIQKNTEYQSVDIKGWQSGKKLGSYTSFGGFKVY